MKNLVTGKVYVGSAVNLHTREVQHRTALQRGDHDNVRLQRSWNKHGADAFQFTVLEFIEDKTQLTIIEQRYIDEFQAFVAGYNLRPKAASNLGMKMRPEAVAAMVAKKIGKKQSPETIAKRLASFIESGGYQKFITANIGRKQTPEEKAKRVASAIASGGKERARLSLVGRVQSEETKKKKSISMTGKKMPIDGVLKSSAARTGKPRPDIIQWAPEKFAMFTPEQVSAIRADRETGMTYKELGEKWNCTQSTAHRVVNSIGPFYSKVT